MNFHFIKTKGIKYKNLAVVGLEYYPYRPDYNNHSSNAISFIPAFTSTSDRLHCEFVRICWRLITTDSGLYDVGWPFGRSQLHPTVTWEAHTHTSLRRSWPPRWCLKEHGQDQNTVLEEIVRWSSRSHCIHSWSEHFGPIVSWPHSLVKIALLPHS